MHGMGGGVDDQRAARALAGVEAEWRASLSIVGPGPGDEYFADLPADAFLEPGQRQAVRDIRAALARCRPAQVRPEETHGDLDDRCILELVIPHRDDRQVQIRLVYGDGYLSLTWPDGEAHDRYEWSPRLAATVEALLSGDNRQTFRQRLGRTYAIDTDVLDPDGRRVDRWRRWRPRAALLAGLVLAPETTSRRTISFDALPRPSDRPAG